MTQTISLKKDATIVVNNGIIVINDRSRRDYWFNLLFAVASLLHGVVGGLMWLRREEPFFIGVYVFVCLVMVPYLVMVLRTSTASKIELDEVESAKVTQRMGHVVVIFRLKNGLRRRVYPRSDQAAELRSFVAANFPA